MNQGSIHFHLEGEIDHPFFDNEVAYRNWLTAIAAKEEVTIEEINYIFCSDEFLLEINKTYLDHDYYTDIITFPYKQGKIIHSDIYISLERVKDNAIEYNESNEDELLRVMSHGLLHLIGYSDKSEKEVALMRSKEDSCVEMFYAL